MSGREYNIVSNEKSEAPVLTALGTKMITQMVGI